MATNKAGRTMKLADVKGVMAYRFVPRNWAGPPKPFCDHVCWYEFDPVKHADEYDRQQKDMHARIGRLRDVCNVNWDGTVSWHSKDGVWTAPITFDPVERPVLVLIGGF